VSLCVFRAPLQCSTIVLEEHFVPVFGLLVVAAQRSVIQHSVHVHEAFNDTSQLLHKRGHVLCSSAQFKPTWWRDGIEA
jgi:hypothetical protein